MPFRAGDAGEQHVHAEEIKCDRNRDHHQKGSDTIAECPRFRWKCRNKRGFEDRDGEDVSAIGRHDQKGGVKCADIHVANRTAELVSHDDEHQRWRNDLRQSSRSRNRASDEWTIIAVTHHDWQRYQAHCHDGRCDDTSCGAEQSADKNDRIGKAATNWAEQLSDGIQKVFGHARPFQDDTHEGKERDRQQCVVIHDPVDAFWMRL